MANELFLKVCPSLARTDTAKYTLADIEKECKEICKYFDLAYPYTNKKMRHVSFCVNWGIDNTNTLGRCHRNSEYDYTLTFNPTYFKIGDPQSIHSTIIHEVLHMCEGCFKHTGEWKYRAQNCQYHLGIPVTRLNKDANYHQMRVDTAKYDLFCVNCGEIGHYRRMTNCVKSVLKDEKKYWCRRCKSRKLSIRQNY